MKSFSSLDQQYCQNPSIIAVVCREMVVVWYCTWLGARKGWADERCLIHSLKPLPRDLSVRDSSMVCAHTSLKGSVIEGSTSPLVLVVVQYRYFVGPATVPLELCIYNYR
jgi:hypothetical protein